MPTAADLMTPAPRTCSTFSTVLEAVMIFRDADCGAVPVTENGEPVGILTDRDVALALIDKGGELIDLPVSDIMTRGVVSVRPNATLEEIESTFAEKAVRRLLVTDASGLLVGIVAWHDVSPYTSAQKLGRVVSDVVEKP
ncbi:MAG TPA: CBS domain-containing protein [Isosphaeraceae bacterium]|jgi:CBS domain-containing protein